VVIQPEVLTMYGPQIREMAMVAEQEHMQRALMERAVAEQRRELRELRGPGRLGRAWAAFWAPRDFVLVPRAEIGERKPADLTPCTDC
jgi:hypothetical protein